ncbi:MAG TPA: hypothetical protein PLQ19_00040 [Aeromicrobium sp.]|nr:hypothetical protein [Aeromicrobium sp.]
MSGNRKFLVTACGLLTVPLVWWLARLSFASWTPQGDLGIQTVKVHDVFSGHLQLLGMPATSYHEVEGLFANHPGSLFLQLISVPYSLTAHNSVGLLVGALVVMGALIIASLRAAELVAGRRGIAVVAISFAAVEVFLAGRMLTGWNPNVTWISLLAALVFGWAVLEGRRGFIAWFVFATALAAQSHVAGVPVAIALFVAVVIGARRQLAMGAAKWALVMGIVVVCWWAPVTDALTRDPGNLQSLVRWVLDGGGQPVAGGTRAVAYLIGVALLVLVYASWHRRDQEVWGSLFTLGAVAAGSVAAVAVLLPARFGYLTFLSGPLALIAVALVRNLLPVKGRAPIVAAVAFGVLALLIPVLPRAESASSDLAAEVTEAAITLLAENREVADLPLVVDGVGPIAWASLASAVQAAAVAHGEPAVLRNVVIDQDQAWRREWLGGARRELLVRESGPMVQPWVAPEGARVVDAVVVRPDGSVLRDLGAVRNSQTEDFELLLLEYR